MRDAARAAYSQRWLRLRVLAIAILACWAVLCLAVPLFVPLFNFVHVAGFPFGFYLVAQGIPILLAIMMFGYHVRASRIEAGDGRRGGS